jgi:outer membrane murein-binding lipoprotein Lpp
MTKQELVRKLTRLLREVRQLRKDVDSINRRLNAAGEAVGRASVRVVRDDR